MAQNKIPSLVNGSTGRPTAAIAGKRCGCAGCSAPIIKGEKCFDIPNPRSAFSNSRRFCSSCFTMILTKTRADIVKLETM